MTTRFIHPGHLDYAQLIATMTDRQLAREWFADTETSARKEPGRSYMVTFAEDASGQEVPAAWAGWIVTSDPVSGSPILSCCHNYVRRGFRGRDPELYAQAYTARHAAIVARFHIPAVTYLYPEPVALHLADGWRLGDEWGVSRAHASGEDHHWRKLHRTPE